jgi:hypothetical protein
MIESRKILYPYGKNDECYTPDYAVEPILKYIPKDTIVWCPFDTEESNFVQLFRRDGFKIINSHISTGQDFYSYEPDKWDIIISNPPFTNKRKIFERALSFNKPFALLMNVVWLNDRFSKMVYKNADRNMQLLLLDKRVKYIKPDGSIENKITFNSSYFCCDLLPRDIIIEEINDKAT